MRVLVCGTNYGSSYLQALHRNESGLVLAGVLARSERSRGIAAESGVPFYTSVNEVPPNAADAACVAIPGPAGHDVIAALLGRGIHVLAEHPVYVADVTAHRATARRHGAVYHVNAHYSDVAAAATFVSAFGAARLRSPLLFIDLMTNARALYSALELIARANGALSPARVEYLAPDDAAFFDVARGVVAGTPLTVQMQRASSEVDDGSAAWVSHRITAGFEEGVLSLAEAYGPVEWIPAPPTIAQLRSANGAAYWSRALVRTLATAPAAFSDYAGWSRDAANRVALARFAAEIATGITPPQQADEHLLGVSQLWQSLLQRPSAPLAYSAPYGTSLR